MMRRLTPERIAVFLFRLAPAAVFVPHGYLKLFGGQHNQTVALFLTVGIPFAQQTAWMIGTLELLGGVLLLAGILQRPIALLLAVEMAVAIYKVRLPQGFLGGWEFELTILLICLALALSGPAAHRIDT